jgi:hypothetical protein
LDAALSRDWEDRELDGDDSEAPDWDGGSRSFLPWALWALIPIALGLVWYFLIREKEPLPPQVPAASAAPSDAGGTSTEATSADEAVKLPPLAESDSFLREMLGALSNDGYLRTLLDTEDLARKFVVGVANVAEGTSPAKQLTHVRPEEPFTAIETSGRTVLDPESYRRYDVPVRFFQSLDTSAIAALYRRLEPLFEEAHSELGLTERKGFRDTLGRAIQSLLAVPVVEGPVRIRAVNVNYVYEDPALEKLSPAQKHLLRMGPENARRVQQKLVELKRALGLS